MTSRHPTSNAATNQAARKGGTVAATYGALVGLLEELAEITAAETRALEQNPASATLGPLVAAKVQAAEGLAQTLKVLGRARTEGRLPPPDEAEAARIATAEATLKGLATQSLRRTDALRYATQRVVDAVVAATKRAAAPVAGYGVRPVRAAPVGRDATPISSGFNRSA